MNQSVPRFAGGVFAAAVALWPAAPATGQTTINAIVRSGDAAPGGSTYSKFDPPALNNAGQVAFYNQTADLSTGYFRGGPGGPVAIGRRLQAVTGTDGVIASFPSGIYFNDAGQVAFTARLSGNAGGATDDTVLVRNDNGVLTVIVRENQPIPDGTLNFNTVSTPVLDASGRLAFHGGNRVPAGENRDMGIFRGNGGPLTVLVRQGQPNPGGVGVVKSFESDLAVNRSGQVAGKLLVGSFGSPGADQVMFRTGTSGLSVIARLGQTVTGGTLNFTRPHDFSYPAMNDAGTVAFIGSIDGSGAANDGAIFRGDGGPLATIARTGQAAPGGNGRFRYDKFGPPALSAAGEVAFNAGLIETAGGTADDSGIFRGDGSTLATIAREGQLVPGGNGRFGHFAAGSTERIPNSRFTHNAASINAAG